MIRPRNLDAVCSYPAVRIHRADHDDEGSSRPVGEPDGTFEPAPWLKSAAPHAHDLRRPKIYRREVVFADLIYQHDAFSRCDAIDSASQPTRLRVRGTGEECDKIGRASCRERV